MKNFILIANKNSCSNLDVQFIAIQIHAFSESSFEIVLMSRVYRQMTTSCDGGGLVFDEIQRIYRARKSYELYVWAKKWA